MVRLRPTDFLYRWIGGMSVHPRLAFYLRGKVAAPQNAEVENTVFAPEET